MALLTGGSKQRESHSLDSRPVNSSVLCIENDTTNIMVEDRDQDECD